MTTVIGTDPTAGTQGGETISVSGGNLCPSGDWSILNGKGVPEDYSLLTIPNEGIIFSDSLEPGGCGRYFGVSNASVRCRLTISLTKTQTGYIRGAFFYRGDDPVEIAIEDANNPDAVSTTIYIPLDKYYPMGTSNGWKMYKVSVPTNDKSKTYRLRITVDAGNTGLLGCSYFSAYNGTFMPLFSGWSKTKYRSSSAPTQVETSIIPIGTRAERTSPASLPADPVIGWVWNGTTWLKLNASA